MKGIPNFQFKVADIIIDHTDNEVLEVLRFESTSPKKIDDLIVGRVVTPSSNSTRRSTYSGNITRAGVDANFILHGSSIIDRVLNKYLDVV
jgi:hypothetical protein